MRIFVCGLNPPFFGGGFVAYLAAFFSKDLRSSLFLFAPFLAQRPSYPSLPSLDAVDCQCPPILPPFGPESELTFPEESPPLSLRQGSLSSILFYSTPLYDTPPHCLCFFHLSALWVEDSSPRLFRDLLSPP